MSPWPAPAGALLADHLGPARRLVTDLAPTYGPHSGAGLVQAVESAPMGEPGVPWEMDAVTRRRWRREACLLCDRSLDGARAVASTVDPTALAAGGDPDAPARPLWFVHHSCYVHAFRVVLLSVPGVRFLAEEEAHAHFRQVLNERAPAYRMAHLARRAVRNGRGT